MTTEEDIAMKEIEIKKLTEKRWYELASQRRRLYVEREKREAEGKPFEAEVKHSIDKGYLNLLDCILKLSK